VIFVPQNLISNWLTYLVYAKSTGDLISIGFSDRPVRSLVSAKRSANRRVQTKKTTSFLADLWSQSEFRTERKSQRKTDRTRRWHVTISRQPDGRPPQPIRPWKSGRVHLAEGSNVVVLELPYSTEFGRGRAAIYRMEIKHVPGYPPMSLVFKNFMTRGSQGFVGQSSPNVAHM